VNEHEQEQEQDQDRGTGPQSEQEMRERLEQELRKLRVEEVVLQSVVSIVNLTARRIAKEDERDLAQAKVGIDAVRALLEVIPPEAARQIREALSELQMLYAREAGSGPGGGGEAEPAGGREEPAAEPPPAGGRRRPEPPPKLWTPPGAS
jgi:hypothetical protein